MAKQVKQYTLNVGVANPSVIMPIGAQLMHLEIILNTVYIYAIVDTDVVDTETRNFYIVQTNVSLPNDPDKTYRPVVSFSFLTIARHLFEIIG